MEAVTRAVAAAVGTVAIVVSGVLLLRDRSPVTQGVLGGPGGSIVSLGDSVPAGSQCDCRPFPGLVRDAVARRLAADTYVLNDAAGGLTSGDVLARISVDSSTTVTSLRSATAVTLTVGANDFDEGSATGCDENLACYGDRIDAMQRNVASIVTRVDQLSGGRAVVLVTGYWGVFRDGAVGAARGAQYVRTARLLTVRVNSALRAAATATSAVYVDVDAAFTASAGADRTSLLARDGDHPNAAGHRVIADALLAACHCA
ncbi:MAG: hypothetical protein QOC60_658 [Frankiaceae bacterium]|nr:hypothetical protein [Frankiaceae bacterium]